MSKIAYLLDANVSPSVANAVHAIEPLIEVFILGGLRGTPPIEASDPELLEYAYQEKLVIVTFDQQTMPGFAFDRVRRGLHFHGINLFSKSDKESFGTMADELLLQWSTMNAEELIDRVEYLPY